jgi:hypothetical protein
MSLIFCGAIGHDAKGMRVYCTRDPDHAGRHIATVGPYDKRAKVLAEWAPDPPHVPDQHTPPE